MTESDDMILYSKEIDTNIVALEAGIRDAADGERSPQDEYALTLLRDFKNAVTAHYSAEAWQRGLSFVNDAHWDEFAAESAEGIYGEAAETPYWDAEKYAGDLLDGWQSFELADTVYWTDGLA